MSSLTCILLHLFPLLLVILPQSEGQGEPVFTLDPNIYYYLDSEGYHYYTDAEGAEIYPTPPPVVYVLNEEGYSVFYDDLGNMIYATLPPDGVPLPEEEVGMIAPREVVQIYEETHHMITLEHPQITLETHPTMETTMTTEPTVTVEPTTETTVTPEPTIETIATTEPTTVTTEPATETTVTTEPTTETTVTTEPTTVTTEPTTVTTEPTTVTTEPTTETTVTTEQTTETTATTGATIETTLTTTETTAASSHTSSTTMTTTTTTTKAPTVTAGPKSPACLSAATARTHICCAGISSPRLYKDMDCCGSIPYNKETDFCCADQVIKISLGKLCCGTKTLYDPVKEICCNDAAVSRTPSKGIKYNKCCGAKPYDGSAQICCESKLFQAGVNTGCCGPIPFAPLSPYSACCLGKETYNPRIEFCCASPAGKKYISDKKKCAIPIK